MRTVHKVVYAAHRLPYYVGQKVTVKVAGVVKSGKVVEWPDDGPEFCIGWSNGNTEWIRKTAIVP